jgi:hypothetical protein
MTVALTVSPRAASGIRQEHTADPVRRRLVSTLSGRPWNRALQKTLPVLRRAPRFSAITLLPSTRPAAGRRGVSVRLRRVSEFAEPEAAFGAGCAAGGPGCAGGLGLDGGGAGGDGVDGGGAGTGAGGAGTGAGGAGTGAGGGGGAAPLPLVENVWAQ